MDELIAALERKARAQAEEILSEARAEAGRIRDDAEREVDRRVAPGLAEKEAAWRAAASRRVAGARRAGARVVLRARERLLDRVFERARAHLDEAARGGTYRAGLAERLQRALSYPAGPAEIACAPALVDAIAEALAGSDEVTVEADPSIGPGFLVRGADGSVEIDETLSGRLDRARPALSIHVVRRLEGAGEEQEAG